MICEKCKNYQNGVCTHLGCNYQAHICLHYEKTEDDLETKLMEALGHCYCDCCMHESGKLVDVSGGMLLYICPDCGKSYTYALEEMK